MSSLFALLSAVFFAGNAVCVRLAVRGSTAATATITSVLTNIGALWILAAVGSSLPRGEVAAILDRLYRHSSTAERRAGVHILRLGKRALPELLRAAAHHPNAFARSVAVGALASHGTRGRRAIFLALRDPAMPVRLAALVALDRVWTRSAAPAVTRLLQDPSGGVRVNAAAVLARHRVRAAWRPLTRLLRDGKWYVRLEAARALGQLGVAAARRPLARAQRDPSPAVRAAAGEAIERL